MNTTHTLRSSLALLILLVAGCTGTQRPEGRLGPFLERYRTQPHYRAFAVAQGTSSSRSYGLGAAAAASTVRQAMDLALARCNRGQDPSLLTGCRLYAVGNIQVYDMDPEQLALAECVYGQNIDADTIEGATLSDCRARSGPVSAGGRNPDEYRTLRPYRALAATNNPKSPGATLGWTSDAGSIQQAIDGALKDCEQRRSPNQPGCQLYSVGDIAVPGVSEIRLERAKCLVTLDPRASSLERGNASSCATVAAGVSSAGSAAGEQAPLGAAEISAQVIGNTLWAETEISAFVFLAADGRASWRSGRAPEQDSGRWRVEDSGQLCVRWEQVNAGQERCGNVTRSGRGLTIGGTRYALIRRNPLEL
jgi:hypothetical protein